MPSVDDQEAHRLAALAQYGPDEPFQPARYRPLLEAARTLFGVPVAYIGLLDQDRQHLVVRTGLEIDSTSHADSFCKYTLALGDLVVVPDAMDDARFIDNPLVIGEPFLRFCATMPLFSPSGHVIGTVGVADTRPHLDFGPEERQRLRDLAALVMDLLELRRLERMRREGLATFEREAALSPDAVISVDRHGTICFWNAAARALFGTPASEAIGQSINLVVPTGRRMSQEGRLRRFIERHGMLLDGRSVEVTALHADGDEFPVELTLADWPMQPGREGPRYTAVARDQHERQRCESGLLRGTGGELLASLSTRPLLNARLELLVQSGEPASVLHVNLQGLRAFNDGAGQSATDIVLSRAAERLLACVEEHDMLARFSGEGFAVLLTGQDACKRASATADAVIQAMAEPFKLDHGTIILGACIGIACTEVAGTHTRDLLMQADIALDQARAEGRNTQRMFTQALSQAMNKSRAHEGDLWRAFHEDEFEVFYQPQVRLSDEVVVGAEALLRWRHPVQGLLQPSAFMPALERTPLSARVGEWVLRTACAQAARWQREGSVGFRIAVNLFSAQFGGGDLAERTRAALADAGLPASSLELEITENILLRHDERMIRPLRELRELGVGIAFDDYGTGYASLSMLKRFPIARLKVDQSFVLGMIDSGADTAIVHAILYLGRSFGLSVIAEGVETQEQVGRLRSEGCQEAQGYLFGRPMTASDFGAYLKRARQGAAVAPMALFSPSRARSVMVLTGR